MIGCSTLYEVVDVSRGTMQLYFSGTMHFLKNFFATLLFLHLNDRFTNFVSQISDWKAILDLLESARLNK